MISKLSSERFTLHLTGIAHGGEALGRHEGKVVFVPYAIPGETVRVQVVDEKDRWARSRLLDVLEASPDRVEPPCPYFGPDGCGGCQWQHIDYARQLDLKREIVSDQLTRLGHVADPPVRPVRAVGDPWGYRNHVQFVVDAQGRLGFRRAGSHEVIPVAQCLLLHPLLDEVHEALDLELCELSRLSLRGGTSTGEQMLVLETKDDTAPELEVDLPLSVVLVRRRDPPIILAGRGHLEEQVAGHLYRVSAASFFQVNTAGAEALVQTVSTYLDSGPNDRLLDAYCGVGLFGLALASQAGQVVGIEEGPSACLDFVANVQERDLDNVALIQGPVEEVLADWLAEGDMPAGSSGDSKEQEADQDVLEILGGAIDLAIVDPPRRGMGHAAAQTLARLNPRRVAYVSCDPATLARDAQAFIQSGYRLVEVQPVDMFPQTFHVESVGLYELGD